MLGRSVGLSEAQLAHLGDDVAPPGVYSPFEATIVRYARQSTLHITIDDALYADLERYYSRQQIVDIWPRRRAEQSRQPISCDVPHRCRRSDARDGRTSRYLSHPAATTGGCHRGPLNQRLDGPSDPVAHVRYMRRPVNRRSSRERLLGLGAALTYILLWSSGFIPSRVFCTR